MNTQSPFVLLILQATPFCNLNCKYCYLPERLDKRKFDLRLIPFVMKNLEKSNLLNKKLRINWHAGEPTVLPISFYEEAISVFEKHNENGIKIEHSFQTNATLLNDEYCKFIKNYDISIGLSIDGPEFINDKNRLYRNNSGSFKEIMKGINLLKKYEIKFSVISVISTYSLNYPDEIYDFFDNLGVKSLGFSVEEDEGCYNQTSMNRNKVEAYKTFLEKFMQNVRENGFNLQQREYVKNLNSIMYPEQVFKNGLVTPLSTITVDINGNYTVFSPELLTVKNKKYDNFIFGNVKTDLFSDVYTNKKFDQIYSEIKEGVKMCKQTCEYFNMCGGGSPSSKLHENGTFASTETNYCIYNIKIPINVILNEIEQHI